MFINEPYLSIFNLKSDAEKELQSQIIFAKSYIEVVDDFKRCIKKT